MNTIKNSMIAVVVVEKDAPVAGPAFEAALQYLEKNQGAKVGRPVLLCGSKIILSKSGQNFSIPEEEPIVMDRRRFAL